MARKFMRPKNAVENGAKTWLSQTLEFSMIQTRPVLERIPFLMTLRPPLRAIESTLETVGLKSAKAKAGGVLQP